MWNSNDINEDDNKYYLDYFFDDIKVVENFDLRLYGPIPTEDEQSVGSFQSFSHPKSNQSTRKGLSLNTFYSSNSSSSSSSSNSSNPFFN